MIVPSSYALCCNHDYQKVKHGVVVQRLHWWMYLFNIVNSERSQRLSILLPLSFCDMYYSAEERLFCNYFVQLLPNIYFSKFRRLWHFLKDYIFFLNCALRKLANGAAISTWKLIGPTVISCQNISKTAVRSNDGLYEWPDFPCCDKSGRAIEAARCLIGHFYVKRQPFK